MNEPSSPDQETFGGFSPPAGSQDSDSPGKPPVNGDGQVYFNPPPPELHEGGSYFMVGEEFPNPGIDNGSSWLDDLPDDYPSARASSSSDAAAGIIFAVGQLVFYLCAAFIYLNALAQTVIDGSWFWFVMEIIFVPFVPVIYPWVASTDAVAWPFNSASALFYAWVLGLFAFGASWLAERLAS